MVTLFHVGFLVADIEEAIKRFEAVLGVTFHAPSLQHLEVEMMHAPEPHRYDSLLTYSREGPPYFELMQADGSEYKGLHQGERIHHVGLWVSDVAEQMARNQANGLREEVTIHYPGTDRIRQWFTDPVTLHGVRLEFFDDAWAADFKTWVESDWQSDLERQAAT